MKTAEENSTIKDFKGTKGKWSINFWEQGDSGVTCKGEANGIKHFTGDNVHRNVFSIVSDLHPNSHNIEHSFEGAHIADISARSEESQANAYLISAAPELLEAIQVCWASLKTYGEHPIIDKQCKNAINKALGI